MLVYGRLATKLKGERFTRDPCSSLETLNSCSIVDIVVASCFLSSLKLKSSRYSPRERFPLEREGVASIICHCSRTRTVDTRKLGSKVIFIGDFLVKFDRERIESLLLISIVQIYNKPVSLGYKGIESDIVLAPRALHALVSRTISETLPS